MTMKLNSASHPATASEIRDIIGPIEDDVIAKILEIEPTSAEVLDAYTWLRSDERLQFRLDHEPHGAPRACSRSSSARTTKATTDANESARPCR